MKKLECTRKSEKGFTLVELAIVMLIIGLLIGGVLKGAELISNAEIASVVAQLKNVEAGTSGFRDKYGDFPGDMAAADVRLPNVAAADSGDGSSTLNLEPGLVAAVATESRYFWTHLNAGGFYSATINSSSAETAINGVFMNVGFVNDGTLAGDMSAPNVPRGHYVNITATNTGVIGDALTPSQAGRIDRKTDDGNPTTGDAFGHAGTAANCGTAAGYEEARETADCGIYVRFQS